VKIRNLAYKGLKKLYGENSAKGVPTDTADKRRKMLAFLEDMQAPEELLSLPAWKMRTLTGDRKGNWSLSVTRIRRLTFRIDIAEREICDLNLEDYHWDKRNKRQAYEEPAPSRRFNSDGDYRACGPLGNGRGCGASCFPARAVQPAQRQS